MAVARQNHDVDPPAIRSIAVFDFAMKVSGPSEFATAVERITAPLWARFEQAGLRPGGIKAYSTGFSHAVFVENHWFVMSVGCQEPVSYEWALWVDAMPGFWTRLFNLKPPLLIDSPPLRSLLKVIDEALHAHAEISKLGWHKKEVLSHVNLTSRAESPF
jgi:hypothetical protein